MEFFITWLRVNYLELIAAAAGLAGVYLTAKQKTWCWPVSIINVILTALVLYNSKLYQGSILQIFYFIMAIYGWYQWVYGGRENKGVKLDRLGPRGAIIYLLVGTLALIASGTLFSMYSDAKLPFWDAGTTVWGIIATYLMARKIIENWIIWIIIDLISTLIFFSQGLYGFMVLYFIFTILAAYGFIEWKKEWKTVNENA